MGQYTGRTAVITGGTIGMGLATARALLAGGAELILTGRNEQNLEAARRELDPRAHIIRSDTASLADIDALGTLVAQTFGQVDFVFINAGVSTLLPLSETSEADYDRMFDVNTKGAFFTARRLAPLVREGGAFVFTTSVANEVGYPGMSAYAGAKAAVRAFALVLAAELVDRNIRVNCVSPGFIRTETMGIAGSTEADRQMFEQEGIKVTPLKRIGTADEVARAALFLAFDATFTTGHELVVDGGLLRLMVPHH